MLRTLLSCDVIFIQGNHLKPNQNQKPLNFDQTKKESVVFSFRRLQAESFPIDWKGLVDIMV